MEWDFKKIISILLQTKYYIKLYHAKNSFRMFSLLVKIKIQKFLKILKFDMFRIC